MSVLYGENVAAAFRLESEAREGRKISRERQGKWKGR